MTENDWITACHPNEADRAFPNIAPNQMLQFLRSHHRVDRTKRGRRQLRLFACACCRRFWKDLSQTNRTYLEIAEQYADGRMSRKDLGQAWTASMRKTGKASRTPDDIVGSVIELGAMMAAVMTANECYCVVASTPKPPHKLWGELHEQAAIIHDIFDNPFQKNRSALARRYSANVTVRNLAEKIYQSQEFGRLPKLAATLENVGCSDTFVIEHCRQTEHFRGCWVLDALRGFSL